MKPPYFPTWTKRLCHEMELCSRHLRRISPGPYCQVRLKTLMPNTEFGFRKIIFPQWRGRATARLTLHLRRMLRGKNAVSAPPRKIFHKRRTAHGLSTSITAEAPALFRSCSGYSVPLLVLSSTTYPVSMPLPTVSFSAAFAMALCDGPRDRLGADADKQSGWRSGLKQMNGARKRPTGIIWGYMRC